MAHNKTPVNQYDKETGEFVQRFDSIMSVGDEISTANIVACLKGRRKSAGGYIWEYVYNIHKHKNNAATITLMMDVNMNIIKEFVSTKQAAEYIMRLGLAHTQNIGNVRDNITNHSIGCKKYPGEPAYGYIWMSKESALV